MRCFHINHIWSVLVAFVVLVLVVLISFMRLDRSCLLVIHHHDMYTMGGRLIP